MHWLKYYHKKQGHISRTYQNIAYSQPKLYDNKCVVYQNLHTYVDVYFLSNPTTSKGLEYEKYV